MTSDSSCQNVKDELFKARDKLLSTLRTYLTMLALLEQTDTFKELTSYIDRFTASELLFKIKSELGEETVNELIEKIAEKYDSSHTTKKEDVVMSSQLGFEVNEVE